MSLRGLLFPYRTHLEQEVEWLKSQLAQAHRRLDEYLDIEKASLVPEKKPAPPAKEKKTVRVQPIGWDAYREDLRRNPPEDEKE